MNFYLSDEECEEVSNPQLIYHCTTWQSAHILFEKDCFSFYLEERTILLCTVTLVYTSVYRRSSSYDGLDLHCFKVTNTPHKI